ncbi:MAG: cupin domain-containing protein [Chloroflexi bacterium]|nr:cupin domain-containing protein [Chloroflexota bacterium]
MRDPQEDTGKGFLAARRGWVAQMEDLERIRKLPRVIKPQRFTVEPNSGIQQITHKRVPFPDEDVPISTFLAWIALIRPPRGDEQERGHGHQNEAVFYILEGEGYELHDGKRYPWQAGDAVIVHAGCVHAHFSADPDRPARALVINPKPLYMHMNLKEQRYRSAVPRV